MRRSIRRVKIRQSALRVVIIYAVAAICWIILSDAALFYKPGGLSVRVLLEMMKGILFVLFTGVLLYFLIKNYRLHLQNRLHALEEAQRDLRVFIYRSSHDLRGPITTAKGLVSLAKSEVEGTDVEEIMLKLDESIHRLDDVMRLLVQLMELQVADIEMEAVSLEELMRGVLAEASHVPGFDQIKFNLDFPREQVILTDRRLLHRALFNIVDNAIRFRRRDIPQPEVSFSLLKQRGQICLNVADNGIGMPMELGDKVYDMFVRGSNMSGGTGLGLYISHKLIHRLRGTLSFSSSPGEGTSFSICLPDSGGK